MNQTAKTLERAMEEIQRLKSQVSSLEKKNPRQQPKPNNWEIKEKKSRLDKIIEGRDAAMERFSNKLFGGKNAKQK